MGNSSRADELIKQYGLEAPQNSTSSRAQQLIEQYGLDSSQPAKRTAAQQPQQPTMWEPTIEDYNEGAAAYVKKKQQQEEAKRGMFSAGLDILGTAALQAQRAVNGVYADQQQTAEETQRALEAYGRFAEAKDQFDEARAPVQWQGREEAVDEYKKAENNYVSKLIRSALIFNPGNDLAEQREKLNDQREKIEVRDIAAGNGPRALTGVDRADQVIGGTAQGIGSSLAQTFGEFTRTYGTTAARAMIQQYGNEGQMRRFEENKDAGWKRVEEFAKSLSDESAASLETAKNGLGITGQAGVDMAQNAIEMTFDHFAGMAVGSPLVVMFARVYGQADMEAQEQGVDVDTAAAYGLSKAAIEVATEKMFDLVGIYGGTGMGDEWVEDLVYKLADDSVGQYFLRTLLNASGEGAEEVVSSLMDPITQMIIDPELTIGDYGKNLDVADTAYSAIIGATLGLFSAAHVGQNRQANAALAVRRNMAEELRSRGYSDNLSEQVAPTLAKAVMGEDLTEAEQAELQRWPTAQEVLQDIETSRELQTIVENAQQAETEEPAAEDDNVPTTEAAETETAQPRRTTMTAEDYARRVIDAEPETVDTSTEEGRARLQSATANLGGYSDAAVQAYESGQDVSTYAAGMYEAAAVYAAAGADVKAAVQQARDGKIRSAMRVLTDKQVAIAEDIGRQMREDTTKAAADVSAAYSVIRQQAAAIGTRAAQNTARISAAVRRANSIGSTAMATFKAQRDALEAMVQANPELEGSEEFNRLFDEAKRNMETVQRMQRAVENLKNKRAKAEEEQRRTTEHKAGRISYEDKSGSVGGVQYAAVDKAKLTETQKAVTRIAEAIAKATGLEIHVARFGGKIGGEYLRGQGGVIWLNIDANYKGANIAVGSLTHEMTHWLQEYAPEEYQQLKRVVLNEMTKDPARFAQIFGERAGNQPNLRPDALTDEMTANACQVLFMDEASVQRIVSENRSLGQKILDFFKSILADIKAAFAEIDTSSDFTLYQEVRAAEGAIDQMRDLFVQAMHTATENLQAERTVRQDSAQEQEERTAGLDTREQTKVQYQRYVQDEETAQFLKDQEDEGKVIHTYKSFLEIDGKLYPPMASKEKGADGAYRLRNAIEPGRWVESEGNLKNIIIDPKNGRGYFNLKKDDGSTIKAAYNPYQHSSNLMLNDQFTGAYSRPNLVTYECIIPESELTSGYRAEYAKDAVGLHPWKSGPVAGKLAKAKGTVRQVYLSRWLKPIRKVPEAEVAQHYKELLDGTDIGVPSNVVPPALLRALEDAGVKIEYDERAPQQSEQMTDKYEKASNSAASEAVSEAESSEESSKTNAQFQMLDSVEETDKLVAVHNKSVSGLKRMLARGGVPFPSIAIKKAGAAHEGFGDVSIVFPRSSIDPQVNRQNRLYSNDAWTPTEPRTEYDVGDTWKLQQQMKEEIGDGAYRATKLGSYLEKTQLERDLSANEGDVVKTLKGRTGIKYAYLKSIGQEPKTAQREKDLDGFGRYKNAQLIAIFNKVPTDELKAMSYDSTETLQKIADVLNEQWLSTLPPETAQLFAGKRPLYTADRVNPQIIKDALRNYERVGGQMESEIDDTALEEQLRKNKALEEDPKYQEWIRKRFGDLIKDSGIPNGKGLYTDAGNRRSFKARHVPATLENVVQQMRKEQEKGIGLGGINLRGAATKAYRSVEDMRKESGKLLREHVFDEEYDSYMKEFGRRLNDLTEMADSTGYDTAKQTLLEAVRDSKNKPDMARRLQGESRWIKYSDELVDELWALRNDVQNMPAPYFEAKPRRIVYPEEALAYILPDNADSSVIKALENKGYNVLTYKAGDEQDRLAKLNSVEGAQFQRWDDTTDDTADEKAGREMAYARIQSENAVLTETVAALRKLTAKQDNTIEKLQKRLQLTKTPEVRETDARNLARQLIAEHSSRADLAEVTAQIKALGDYLLQTNTQDVSEDELKNRARQIAAGIIDAATEDINLDSERYQQIAGAIKGKKLSIDEDFLGELDAAGGYEKFRKSLFGSLTLAKRDSNTAETREDYTSVSQFYADMQSTYGKGSFPDVANEGEEVQILAQMLDAGKPTEVNPYEKYRGEATEELSNRIVMDALSGVLRTTPPTDADRQKSRRVALQQQIKALKAENKLSEREAGRLYATIYDLSVALDKAESRYTTLRKEADIRAAKVYQEGLARAAEIKASERARAAGQIKDLKEHYKEIAQRAKDRREESAGIKKYRKQVDKKAKALYELLMTNSNDKHVPQALKIPLGEFLESLDFSSKRSLAGGDQTQADLKLAARMQRVQQMLENQQRYINGDSSVKDDFGGYIDVSPDMLEYLREMSERITETMNAGRTFTINQMSAEELRGLSNLLSNLTQSIKNMNQFMANARYASVQEAASKDVEFMVKLGKVSKAGNSGTSRFLLWENGVPYYLFKRFGSGGVAIFDGFTKGWEKMAFNAQEIIKFTEEAYTDKEVRQWKQESHDFTLEDGQQIHMTTGQVMELSQLLGRDQAVRHIERGGIRIGNIDSKTGQIVDTNHYHLTDNDISMILGSLSARQLEVAKKMQSYMAKRGAEWGNEISMRRFGYNFYEEGDNYYPIRTDSNDRALSDTDAQQNSMFRLLNLSSSKALNPKASNALIVGDIFDTFSDHMSDMAKLNGMGLPILDAIKWFNYKERIDRGDGTYDTVTLQGAMEEAYGGQAQHYFRTLMKDINGLTETGDRGTGLAGKFLGNYKAAAVGANLRVAMLQPTSYLRALTVIKPQYLAAAFGAKNGYQEAMKYSGTAVWKSLGYYDTDISKGMRGQIQHDDTRKDKIVEKSMVLAELGDKLTWGRLWNACKMQTKAENRSLSGEALNQKTADLFRAVIYSSQVMDATLTRSEIMRGKGVYSKMSSAFMAEPTLSYNILLDAASDYDIDRRRFGAEEARKRNLPKIGRAFIVYAASATFSAVIESLADAARDDDDESFWDKFLEAFLGDEKKLSLSGNLMQDLTIIGKIPYLKNLASLVQGYKSGDMSISAFSSVADAYNIWKETYLLSTGALEKATKVTYYGKMTEWGKIYKTLQALSQLSGIPAANMTRDVFAIWNTIVNGTHNEWKIETYDNTKDRNLQRLIKATEGGDAAAVTEAVAAYDDEKAALSALKSALKTSVTGGERTAADASEMLVKAGMTKNDAFFLTQGWETGDSGKYTAIKRAALAGDTAAFRQAMSDLTTHGVKQTDAQGAVKTFIRALYMGKDLGEEEREIAGDKKLTSAQARKLLHDYGGLSVDDAVSTVGSWDEVLQFNRKYGTDYETYGLTINQARYYYDNDTVKSSLRFADYASQVDKYGLDAVKKYYGDEDWKATGLTMAEYADYAEKAAKCKGTDKNGDGKVDRYSKKNQMVELITSLPVSIEVKDAIYLKNGWSASQVRSMPWH